MKDAKRDKGKIEGDGGDLAKVLLYFGLIPDASRDEWSILCPLHEDINPSMMANISKGVWCCFGCGGGGNALDLVQAICRRYKPDINRLEAAIELERIRRSDEVKAIRIQPRHKTKEDKSRYLAMARDFYEGLSSTDWMDPPSYAERAWRYISERGYTASTLIAHGAKACYKPDYPIIFPIRDNGEFCGWVCRTDKTGSGIKMKYLYNTGFSRNTTLCGYYEDGNPLTVVEGYLDMLKMRQFGIRNVVAFLGWKASKYQIDKIRDAHIPYIVCALDNDDCGRKGYEYLKTLIPTIRWAYLKSVKDAGDMDQRLFNVMYEKTKKRVKAYIRSERDGIS